LTFAAPKELNLKEKFFIASGIFCLIMNISTSSLPFFGQLDFFQNKYQHIGKSALEFDLI